MDIFFNVLLETFDQKLAFVVYFGEERPHAGQACTKSERTRLSRYCRCLVMISYTESNARYHREDQIKSKEALFGQEASFTA